ncbi:MAG: endonuclease V [Gemmatimonadota bacterium]|nr:MAG: endonuclease V [Gemmatimonadota bacterium]
MRIPPIPHRWSVTTTQAIAIQQRLTEKVRQRAPRRELRLVAGIDAAFSRSADKCIAGVVLWDSREDKVIERHVAVRTLTFPYVPGLLSFREAPAAIAALRKLRTRPDALMCDGHGRAHPRRCGLACHIGVLSGLSTVGCAKSRLVGEYREPRAERGGSSRLVHDGEVVGVVLRTRTAVRPVFVSVGHEIDLAGAVELVLRCATRFRLPEPTRLADRLVAEFKRSAIHSGTKSVLGV